jgi:hypothetical protein
MPNRRQKGGKIPTAWQEDLPDESLGNGEAVVCLFVCLISVQCFFYFLLSLDQLLASVGYQQRLQAVLSLVGSKSPILPLIQEAKAQSEVSGVHRMEGCECSGGGAGAGLSHCSMHCHALPCAAGPCWLQWEMLEWCH